MFDSSPRVIGRGGELEELAAPELLSELQNRQVQLEEQNESLRETQASMEDSRSRYFLLFDQSPICYFVFDRKHQVIEVNVRAAELLGVDRVELRESFFDRFLHEQSQSLLHEHLSTVFDTREGRRTELKLKGWSGAVIFVEVDTSYLAASAYEQAACVSAWTEITQRKLAEEAYASEHRLLRTLVEFLPEAVYVRDLNGRMLVTNEACEAWLAGCLVGDETQAGRVRAEDVQLMRTGQAILNREEQVSQGEEGGSLCLLTTKIPLRDAGGAITGMVGLSRDVTELKQSRQEQERLNRKLEETQKLESLGVLAGGIAHDFNNLLTAILGNTSLALMEVEGQLGVERRLRDVQSTCLRAAELCRQMLAYSGKAQLNVAVLDLNELIRDTSKLLEVSVSKRAVVRFKESCDRALISGDATQLRQIVMNLVINASEALGAADGSINIETSLVQADRRMLDDSFAAPDAAEGKYVQLEVRDTGSGMASDTLKKIFDPFYTTKKTGRGLGLAAVLGILRSHRGGIQVSSRLGVGTTFRLLLPVLPVSATLPPPEIIREEIANGRLKAEGAVLLVDDEESIRGIACDMLTGFGFKVYKACDGAEAVVAYHMHRHEIQMVLMDLTMPKVDGVQAFEKLREISPDVPILLMSGYTQHERVPELVKKGRAGFIHKPFEVASLRQKIVELQSIV